MLHIDVEEISDHILEIFEKRSTCQETYDVEDVVDEDEEAESESLLIAAAADLVAALCETIGQGYVSYFNAFLPQIAKYYASITFICLFTYFVYRHTYNIYDRMTFN